MPSLLNLPTQIRHISTTRRLFHTTAKLKEHGGLCISKTECNTWEHKLTTNLPNTKLQFPIRKELCKGDAGVMMILADYKNIPSVLFTVRSSNLRSHTGEVSFPGGKKDPSDINVLDCALREVEEEVNISRSDLQVLGQHNLLLPNKSGTLCVYPFISVLKTPIDNINQIKFNKEEVEKVFFTPIDHLLDPKNRYWRQFRNTSLKAPVFKPQEGEKEIWGLTGFILYNCLKTMYPGKF